MAQRRLADDARMEHVDGALDLLLSSAALQREFGRAGLRSALANEQIVRIRRGWYVRATDWKRLHREARHLVRVVAAAHASQSDARTFSHVSAAVLWGLPIWEDRLDRVHVIAPEGIGVAGTRGATPTGVARHEVPLSECDRVFIGAFACTGLTRTVVDLLRWQSRGCALAALDAALRIAGTDPETGHLSVGRSERLRESVARRIAALGGHLGVVQARELIPLGDPLAETPGESVSRLMLLDLGFARPRLQVPVPAPSGANYRIDFSLDDVDAWGEFDGSGKYFDPAMLRHRTPREALRDEKLREDWIRARTGRRVVRWTTEHLASPAVFAAHLRAHGIRPRPTPPTH